MCDQRDTCFVLLLIQMFTFWAAGQQTMDELISNAAETPQIFAMPKPGGEGGSPVVRLELDMVFTQAQWQWIQRSQEQSEGLPVGRVRRKAIRGQDFRWPRGVIPYEFDSNAVFSSSDRQEIQKAIDEWHAFTCVKFVRARNSDRNKIRFVNGGGCFSNVGMVGKTQAVGLAQGCRWKSVVTHELGHAVGFQHEQTRPDRDRHVSIVRQNIPPQLMYNFRKYSTGTVDMHRLPYDYHSIMHYGARAFSINGQPTIRTRVSRFQDVIGRAQGLSFLDIKLANLLYQCDAHCGRHIDCPPEGFVDKSCRCMCRGDPVRECSDSGAGAGSTTRGKTGAETGTSTRATAGSRGECSDQYGQCREWAQRGECEHEVNKVYMQAYCRRSCSLCQQVPEEDDCKDTGEHCEFWRKEGHCTRMFVDFMRANCALTCGHCRPDSSERDGQGRRRYHTVISNNPQVDVTDSGLTTRAMTLYVVIGFISVLMLRE